MPVTAAAALLAAALAAQDKPLTVYPHPLLTEILFAVPKDSSDPSLGDADGDGSRHATGDEFIELINPHDQPINLAGYRIADAHPKDKNRFEFTFPDVVLEPGQAAVVFNGVDQHFDRGVGTDRTAGKPSPAFHHAYVFDARNDSRYVGLANAGDAVVLFAPDGSPLTCVWWGESEAEPPHACPVVEEAPKTDEGSVRLTDDGSWEEHPKVQGVPYSPGIHPEP